MVGKDAKKWVWLIFIPIVIFIITAVSNGANLTDGIDGLACAIRRVRDVAKYKKHRKKHNRA